MAGAYRTPPELADLLPSGTVSSDLHWFFSCSKGEQGLRSSHSAFVASLESGGHSGYSEPHELDPRAFAAATRARPIADALGTLPHADQRTLQRAYDDGALAEAYGRQAVKELAAYGSVSGLAPYTPTAETEQALSERPMIDWLARVAKNRVRYLKQGRLYLAITREAETSLITATMAYAKARKLFTRTQAPKPERAPGVRAEPVETFGRRPAEPAQKAKAGPVILLYQEACPSCGWLTSDGKACSRAACGWREP